MALYLHIVERSGDPARPTVTLNRVSTVVPTRDERVVQVPVALAKELDQLLVLGGLANEESLVVKDSLNRLAEFVASMVLVDKVDR